MLILADLKALILNSNELESTQGIEGLTLLNALGKQEMVVKPGSHQ